MYETLVTYKFLIFKLVVYILQYCVFLTFYCIKKKKKNYYKLYLTLSECIYLLYVNYVSIFQFTFFSNILLIALTNY